MAQSAWAAEYNCFSAEGQVSSHKFRGWDTKQSDCDVLVMLELWGILSTHLLLPLPGTLLSGVVAPDILLSIGQIELFEIYTVLLLN